MSDKDKDSRDFKVKKLTPLFVDEVANISISPNGASRIQFISWQTNEAGEALRVDSELIMTTKTLSSLASNLPKAIRQASEVLKTNKGHKQQSNVLTQ